MARVTALLAHAPGLPEGDITHGLEFTLCLDARGHIDLAAYGSAPLPWRTRRYWPGRPDWWGELVRDDGSHWALRRQGGEDEPIWTLSFGVMRPGALVSLHRPNGETLIYRIVKVEQE